MKVGWLKYKTNLITNMFSLSGVRGLKGALGKFSFGETVMQLKREKEIKLAQKLKESLEATYIAVDDITIGTNSCN